MFDIRKIQEQAIYNAVKTASNEETASAVVYGSDNEAKTENDPGWVKSTMKRLERCFDTSTVLEIRRSCQCGYGMGEKLKLVKELMALSSSVEELGNLKEAHDAGLFYENGRLYLQFHFCPCPMLAEVDRLETSAWCQCTTGYSKVLFEQAFGCKVEVELYESIKMGNQRCLMAIIPEYTTW